MNINRTTIEKKLFIPDYNNTVYVECPFMDFGFEDYKVDSFTEVLCSQYKRGLIEALDKYNVSPLPNKYINGQDFLVKVFPSHYYGFFHYDGDIIEVDADTISGMRKICSSYLLGHELGHKISKYIDTDEVFEELGSIFDIPMSRKDILEETFADVVGYTVSGQIAFVYPFPTSVGKNEYAKKRVLRSIYKI